MTTILENSTKYAINQRFIDCINFLISENKAESKTEIAENLNITKSKFSEILNKRMNIGVDTLSLLSNSYKVSVEWLVLGKKPMFIKESNYLVVEEPIEGYNVTKAATGKSIKKKGVDLIPFYNIDFLAGNSLNILNDNIEKPEYYMDIPEFYGCTAFRTYSDSMEKLIKSGTILFGKEELNWQEYIEFGQIYGIVCNDGRKFLKYIKKSQDNTQTHFTLKSHNEFYDDFDIAKKFIKSIWLIHGWLNKNI